MKVQMYLLDVAPLSREGSEETAEFQELCAMLSEKRREKIRKFRFAQGKALSLGAGLLLDYGLRKYGVRERDAVLVYGRDEKPYLRDYPEIFFNLSHSGTMAMAVFADRETGCDVEKIGKADFRVARRFFAEKEREILEGTKEERERTELFYRLWVLKESFLKVTGKGIRMPMDEFCIHIGRQIRVEMGGKFCNYGFQEFSLPGYRAALCLEGAETAEAGTECLQMDDIWLSATGTKGRLGQPG